MDQQADFSKKVRSVILKWLIFVLLGISAYTLGLYLGIKKLHKADVQTDAGKPEARQRPAKLNRCFAAL